MGPKAKTDMHGRAEALAKAACKTIAAERQVQRLLEIGRECAALPVKDNRSPDEMLYDEHGLPK